MPKVQLEYVGLSSRGVEIKAPDFCPYRSGTGTVNPALCPLCKICTFVPETVPLDLEITQTEKDAIAKFLTSENKVVSASLSGQNQYLQKQGRLPLVVLISYPLFESCMRAAATSNERFEALKSHFVMSEEPIAWIMGCPIYYNNKLTQSQVQLVGEIVWK